MANIEFKTPIRVTENTTLYGHQSLDPIGMPVDAGNFKLSDVLGIVLNKADNAIQTNFEFVKQEQDKYNLCYKGVTVATLALPPDRFLASATFNQSTKKLVLTFNTSTSPQSVEVDLSMLVDVYRAGNGLELLNSSFRIKLTAGEARLKVAEGGLSLDLTDITTSISNETKARQNADELLNNRITTIETTWEKTWNDNLTTINSALTESRNLIALTNQVHTDVTAIKEKVEGFKNQANTSATNAKTSADNAKVSEQKASASATSAENSKNQAQALLSEADNKMIKSIAKTTNNTGSSQANTVRVTLKDNTTHDFTVYNGAQGGQGIQGPPGKDGKDGATGPQGLPGTPGLQGPPGEPGKPGEKGDPGDTAPVGTFIWYCGKTRPTGYLVCDGASYSKTTYSALYAVIGNTFNGKDSQGNDIDLGTNFKVPLLTDKNRFIRSSAKDGSDVGTMEDDAIRPITGRFHHFYHEIGSTDVKGAFVIDTNTGNTKTTNAYWGNAKYLGFNANSGTETDNPMKGHANGTDTHPYNVRLLPLIKYT